jgi:hypothetical protein
LEEEAAKVGLKINEQKTKALQLATNTLTTFLDQEIFQKKLRRTVLMFFFSCHTKFFEE